MGKRGKGIFLCGRLTNTFLSRIAQVASILIIGLIAGYILNSVKRDAFSCILYFDSAKGSVSELFMPDGTHVFMNSGSEIKYSIDGVHGIREFFLNGDWPFSKLQK
jgi:ferric-dicitrate binding protein FerR (iron transport regulator)